MRREEYEINKGRFCSVDDCERPAWSRGWCKGHYQMQWRGEELRPLRAITGRVIDSHGYVLLKMRDHPNAQQSGYVPEHVVVVSEALGRPLLSEENVHHRNGVRDDNRPENLELWSTSQPSGQRVEDKLAWARDIIELYG